MQLLANLQPRPQHIRRRVSASTFSPSSDSRCLAAILGQSGLRVVQRYIHVTEEPQEAAMLRYDATIQDAEKGRASSVPVLQ
ncbi:MAG: hypothetical protein A3H27_01755 [Acidobacteria bacterium RIFCSPLOWO2_02_FULL_59_13]|nr:MAG: hypothetical protein A3H27_01755 [Acidobacteria bacterium RIFCSPLOWO2_02_FULL_59_13]